MSGPVFEFDLGQEVETPKGPMFVASRWFDASGPAPGVRYGLRACRDDKSEPQVSYHEDSLIARDPGDGVYKFALNQEVNTRRGPMVVSACWVDVRREDVVPYYRVHARGQTAPLITYREDELEAEIIAPGVEASIGIERASGESEAVFRSVRPLDPVEIKPELKVTIASGRLPELGGDGDEIWRRVAMVPEAASELEVEVDRVSYLEGALRLSGERIAELWAEKEQLAGANSELREELTRTDGELSDLRLEAGARIDQLEKSLSGAEKLVEGLYVQKAGLEGEREKLAARNEKLAAANLELTSRLAVAEADLGQVRRDAGWQIEDLKKVNDRLRESSKTRICELEGRVETLREVNAEQAKTIEEQSGQEQAFLREVDGLGEDHAKLAEVNAQLMQQIEELKGEVIEARKLAAGNAALVADKDLLAIEVNRLRADLRAQTHSRVTAERVLSEAKEGIQNLEASLSDARKAYDQLRALEALTTPFDGVREAVQAVMREAANG